MEEEENNDIHEKNKNVDGQKKEGNKSGYKPEMDEMCFFTFMCRYTIGSKHIKKRRNLNLTIPCISPDLSFVTSKTIPAYKNLCKLIWHFFVPHFEAPAFNSDEYIQKVEEKILNEGLWHEYLKNFKNLWKNENPDQTFKLLLDELQILPEEMRDAWDHHGLDIIYEEEEEDCFQGDVYVEEDFRIETLKQISESLTQNYDYDVDRKYYYKDKPIEVEPLNKFQEVITEAEQIYRTIIEEDIQKEPEISMEEVLDTQLEGLQKEAFEYVVTFSLKARWNITQTKIQTKSHFK